MLASLRANMLATALGILSAILLAICVYQSVQRHGFLGIDGDLDRIDRLRIDNNELRAGVKAAEELNRQQVERITAKQQEVSHEIERDLTARLERLRSELRSKAPQGAPRGPTAGPDGQAPANPDGAAGLCLAAEELLRAAENEERHDQLIRWVEEQLKVER